MTKTGVYKITNNITGDFYIGSSKNIRSRWTDHKSPSTWVINTGMKLYQAFIKYGLDNFTFEIIEETANLHEREQYWIDLLKPTYNSNRANGRDIEKYKKARRIYQQSEKSKECHRRYRQSENGKENNRKYARKSMKRYNNQLCLYNGETITLNALAQRFYIAGIEHPTLEAKKYLLNK